MKKILMISLAIMVIFSLSRESSSGQTGDPLRFPKSDFKLETKKVKTTAGEKLVTYRSYQHLTYVAHPVDKEYQSLNVSVPVKVDEVAIDASNAPILFAIGVGGYMSVNNVREGAGGPMGRMPGGPGAGPGGNNKLSGNKDLALAAGYVVVTPGCRGRDNKAADGTFYGKAPAAIVDLKAAVRYLRHNKGILPGNTDWIFSTGVSAGGALSALLGASGNSSLFEPYLKEIGAADAKDDILGSACFCPITDLDHADGAYEWMYGTTPTRSGLVDQDLSTKLKSAFSTYQASLKLMGKNGFGLLTADNYSQYLVQNFLIPSANKFLSELPAEKRKEYLETNKWISWQGNEASFSFENYVNHVGRMKGLPAFDDFDCRQPEPNEFGNKTIDSRHFTNFSLQHSIGDKNATIDSNLKLLVNLMNAMYFMGQNNPGCTNHWWLRQGSSDNHSSQTVMANLAATMENQHREVNMKLYWDAGHGADEDAEDFIAWIGRVTGYQGATATKR